MATEPTPNIMNNCQSKQVHIALSPWDLTDDYNRHAGVTMLSALDHCSYPAVVHLLYDANLSLGKEKEEAYNKACYQKIADRYGCELHYHHVNLPEWVYELETVKKWTPGTLMRLYLPEILPNVQEVLYLDCDMVVQTNLDPLFETQLNENYLAACLDDAIKIFSRKRKKTYRKVGISKDNYFCAGILVMNLEALRNLTPHSFTDIIFTYLKENPSLPYLDQDMLNWFCQDKYVQLDDKMNIYVNRSDAIDNMNDCILHYINKDGKPWRRYHGIIDEPYWNYLMDTPWCYDKTNLANYIREAPDVENAIPYLKNNFLLYISGNKKDKAKKLITFTIHIWYSVYLWILTEMKHIMSKIGLL